MADEMTPEEVQVVAENVVALLKDLPPLADSLLRLGQLELAEEARQTYLEIVEELKRRGITVPEREEEP